MTNAPVAADAVIRVTDLKKYYGEVRAVDGVSFEVRPGEIFGLLGPNGAGKTTTVDILEGLREPDSGEVRVLGLDVAKDANALKPRIGVSLQTAALYPKLTVIELIDLFRSFYPKSRPTPELIEALGLTERSKAQSKDLSGGQRQRLAVALSLVNDPELVFLDEPTTGLDPAARRSLWTLVEGLKAAGTSVLLTTHYMEEAEILCDRLAIMDHGKVLELGTVEELVSKHFKDRAVRFDPNDALDTALLEALPSVSSVHVDDTDALVFTRDVGATIGGLLAAAEARGVEPQNLSIRRASLEDVFLSLTGRALRD
jgi:ABC-2 type transport system ATP-binding protein